MHCNDAKDGFQKIREHTVGKGQRKLHQQKLIETHEKLKQIVEDKFRYNLNIFEIYFFQGL